VIGNLGAIARGANQSGRGSDRRAAPSWPIWSVTSTESVALSFARIRTRCRAGFCQIPFCVNDQIHIRGFEVLAHIGVPDEERATAQRLTFHLTLWPARQMDELKDEIGRAVDYANVCGAVKSFVEPRRDNLIETMANGVAMHLLQAFELRRVTVELRKYILPDVEFVSVSVTRERAKE